MIYIRTWLLGPCLEGIVAVATRTVFPRSERGGTSPGNQRLPATIR